MQKRKIVFMGNPNVGKSTLFNRLTGLNQHTGNWPGKTVGIAEGEYTYKDISFTLVDVPGTYSLMTDSVEEEVARDFICFENMDGAVIVVDATSLERNLNLVLQTLEMTENVVLCVNLMDEAKRKNIDINIKKLSEELVIPVVGTSANKGTGIKELMEEVYKLNDNRKEKIEIKYDIRIEDSINEIKEVLDKEIDSNLNNRWLSLRLLDNDELLVSQIDKYLGFNLKDNKNLNNKLIEIKEKLKRNNIGENNIRDYIVSSIVKKAEDISNKVVSISNYKDKDRKIDKYLTSKIFGIPIMIIMLGFIFFLTITGANYPSKLLSEGLFYIEDKLTIFFTYINAPSWLHGVLVLGMYRTLAWVVSVMLPPMAIFFPLFTILEDLGYLPRVAFNLDKLFKKASACGKQALTMCMGFGCNAAGVVGCRIIGSKRERLIAIITNNFVPCNGRFPTLIAIITMFFAFNNTILSTLILTAVIVFGIMMTLFVSKLLSKTILKGIPSTFTLELPPYRKPQIGRVIIRSVLDRTLFVLGRAIMIAAPSGIVIWSMANITVNNMSILTHCANFLNPFANLIGLDGYILMAFILGFPANEIVIPIIIMSYMATGNILELDSLTELKNLLIDNNWTYLTAICVMLFSLMHWPCGTTCITIKKETKSIKWTLVSFLVPTVLGISICFIVTNIVRILGLV